MNFFFCSHFRSHLVIDPISGGILFLMVYLNSLGKCVLLCTSAIGFDWIDVILYLVLSSIPSHCVLILTV